MSNISIDEQIDNLIEDWNKGSSEEWKSREILLAELKTLKKTQRAELIANRKAQHPARKKMRLDVDYKNISLN